ncbi:MAG: hypothetical protein ABIT38_02630 [Gemmatimonadaceae bacterium]
MRFYIGLPMATDNWVGLTMLSARAMAVFATLAWVEDRRLVEVLGANYAEYAKYQAESRDSCRESGNLPSRLTTDCTGRHAMEIVRLISD